MHNHIASGVAVVCLFGIASAAVAQQAPPQQAPSRPAAPGTRPAATAPAQQGTATFQQQVSYALGRNFAANLKGNEIECDLQYLIAGITDALRNAQPRWTDEQLQPVMQQFSRQMEQKMGAKFERLATQNQQEAAKFLTENAKREGVQTTTSGLQFRVVKQGTGPSPTINDRVRCHYRGTLLNGTEFDSSANQGGPAEFSVAEVIPGWTEALQKMRVGDKWQLFVPPDLAYGMNPHPSSGLEPNSLLVFDIELLEVLPQ
jgi:FKBP-type peptidyl-prolyl cis-trans isomerase